ncbi:hypothetical protein ACQPZX_28285 [Actinoplanes sp. CA-142083]|uniref:hypothetical protein n=1 Tax=Actinoplanes sp. CA-142083 TaxID=3239903 RepID=UPI003D91A776
MADGSGTVRTVDGRSVSVGGVDPRMPPSLVAGAGKVWSYRLDSGDVSVIDPAAAKVTGHGGVPVATPLVENRLIVAHKALWIGQPGKLSRITPSGQVTQVALPERLMPSAATATRRWLWLASGKRLLRIDPAAAAQPSQPGQASGSAQAAGVVETALPESVGELDSGYAAGINSPVVRRLDPDTGRVVAEVRMPHDELVMSLAGGWAIGNCGTAMRLTDRLAVRVADVSQDLPAVAAVGSLWVGDEVRSEIVRIDAASGHVLARMPFVASDPDDPAFYLVAGESTVWVLDQGVSKVDTVANRVARVRDVPGMASAVAY